MLSKAGGKGNIWVVTLISRHSLHRDPAQLKDFHKYILLNFVLNQGQLEDAAKTKNLHVREFLRLVDTPLQVKQYYNCLGCIISQLTLPPPPDFLSSLSRLGLKHAERAIHQMTQLFCIKDRIQIQSNSKGFESSKLEQREFKAEPQSFPFNLVDWGWGGGETGMRKARLYTLCTYLGC